MKTSINPPIDDVKYRNAILYFTNNCNNQFLGLTKLNKLMYYLDFISFRDRSSSVTNDKYIHKDYGPVPDRIDDVITSLSSEGQLLVEEEPWKDGYKYRFEPKSKPNLKVFDKYELGLLDKLCKEFQLWTTDKIVNQTHLEAPWFYSKPFEVVDYKYASSLNPFEDEPALASQQDF